MQLSNWVREAFDTFEGVCVNAQTQQPWEKLYTFRPVSAEIRLVLRYLIITIITCYYFALMLCLLSIMQRNHCLWEVGGWGKKSSSIRAHAWLTGLVTLIWASKSLTVCPNKGSSFKGKWWTLHIFQRENFLNLPLAFLTPYEKRTTLKRKKFLSMRFSFSF